MFFSSDENIISVNSNGLIRALSQGSANVFVRTLDGKYEAKCSVSVLPFNITNHISLEIEDRITDSEKGTHTVYYTFKNESNKSVKITKSWIYFDGNPQFGDTGTHIVSGNSIFQKTSWRYSRAMTVGFEVYYEYGGDSYRIYKSQSLSAYN